MLRLITFGGLRIENGTVVNGAANPRSRLAILAVIAAGGDGGVRRERLTAMFWADSNDDRARNALRQALFVLKRDVGGVALTEGVTHLSLNAATVSCDISDFERAIAGQRWEDAVAVYAGPFLEGVFLREAPEFERWVDEQRQRLSSAFGNALEALAVTATARGDLAGATTWWERRSRHDPYSARVAVGFMKALVANGERERALQYSAAYAGRLRAELEVEPEDEVRKIDAMLRVTRPHSRTGAASEFDARAPSMPSGAPLPVVTGAPGAVSGGRPREYAVRQARRWITAALASVGVISALVFATRLRPSRNTPVGVGNRVLVAPFANRTGDPGLDALGAMVADFVAQGIQRADILEVTDPLTSALASKDMADPGNASTDIATAMRAGAGTLVSGAFYRRGDSLHFQAEVFDVARELRLAVIQPVTTPRGDAALIAMRVREATAGALATIVDPRLASIGANFGRAPSLAAYREFRRGLELFTVNDLSAVPYFHAAVQLDTTFIQPLIWTAFAYGNGGQDSERDSVVAILAARRSGLQGLEAQAVDYLIARSDSEALQATMAAAALSPGSHWSHNSSNRLLAQNRLVEALGYSQQIDPERGWARGWFPYWKNLSNALHLLERYDEELQEGRRALRLSESNPGIRALEVRALIALGRIEEAERLVEEMTQRREDPVFTVDAIRVSGLEFRKHGHPEAARRTCERAARMARETATASRRPAPTIPAWQAVTRAWCLYDAGKSREVVEVVESLARLAIHPYDAGSAAVLRGLVAPLPRESLRTPPMDARDDYQRARVALAARDTAEAMRRLGDALESYVSPDIVAWLHRDPEWTALRDYAPFRRLTAPR